MTPEQLRLALILRDPKADAQERNAAALALIGRPRDRDGECPRQRAPANAIAWRGARTLEEYDRRFAVAFGAIYEAILRCDLQGIVRFETWAKEVARREVARAEAPWSGASQRDYFRVAKARRDLEKELGVPTLDEIAERASLHVEDVATLLDPPSRLNAGGHREAGDDEPMQLQLPEPLDVQAEIFNRLEPDAVPPPTPDDVARMLRAGPELSRQQARQLHSHPRRVAELMIDSPAVSAKQREALRAVYLEGKIAPEWAQERGISKQAAYQLLDRAEAALKGLRSPTTQYTKGLPLETPPCELLEIINRVREATSRPPSEPVVIRSLVGTELTSLLPRLEPRGSGSPNLGVPGPDASPYPGLLATPDWRPFVLTMAQVIAWEEVFGCYPDGSLREVPA